MSDYKPKQFTIVRAESDIDDVKLRDEKISSVLNENPIREYKFKISPLLTSEYPMILIMPDSEADYYWRTLLESMSTLSGSFASVVREDAPKGTIQEDLKNTLCKMSEIMNYVVNSESWKSNELNDVDRKDINEMLRSLNIPDSL